MMHFIIHFSTVLLMKSTNFSEVLTGDSFYDIQQVMANVLLYLSLKSMNDITSRVTKIFIIHYSRTDEKVFSLQNA